MLTFFLILRFTVVAAIAALSVSAASIPRPRERGNGISIPLTKRSRSLNSDSRFSINRFKSRAVVSYTEIIRGIENYERNTGTIRPSALKYIRSQNWKSGGAGIELTMGSDDDVWYGTIFIGTPPQLFTVQLDTGSSDLFIPASAGDAICTSHDHLWDPTSSQTAQDLDKSFELKFLDGTKAGGKQYTDNITIASFTADKQTFGVATTYSAQLERSRSPSDGMLGLAFPSLSGYPASPLLQTLFSEGKLPDNVFALKLASNGGEMYIGGVNEKLYTGDITFVDVQTGKGLWEVVVDDIRVNNKPVLTSIVSVIDTGANYIFGDPARLLTLHQAYGGKAFEDGWYSFPCNDFPDVTLTFAGKAFTIPADNLNLGPVVDGSPDCFSGIVAFDNPDSAPAHWSIGINFLECFYTVFNVDHEPPQVGFAYLEELSDSESEA